MLRPSRPLIENRRRNLEEVRRLVGDVYPFDFAADRDGLGDRAGAPRARGRGARARRRGVATAGRILARRTQGKAGFLDLSDGSDRLQVYVRKDAVGERGWELYPALDLGDWIGVAGDGLQDADGRADGQGPGAHVPRQVPPAAAREVARPEGRRAAVPAAVPRSGRQPGVAARLRGALGGHPLPSAVPRRSGLPRGRDADDAADPGRRAGAPVRDAPQRARPRASTCGSRRSCT